MRKDTNRLFAVDGTFLRYISVDEHNHKIASGQCMAHYIGDRYVGIKFVQQEHEECRVGSASKDKSPTGLTMADMMRNAAGVVDTQKRSKVHRLNREAQERGEPPIPAAIRCYGHDKHDKPRADLLGNAVDRSMTRVENWAGASESNRAVTVVPGGVLGVTELPADHPVFAGR